MQAECLGSARPAQAGRSGAAGDVLRQLWGARWQIRDLNSGTFGFVELALDKTTGQQVAVKFIERGDKVPLLVLPSASAASTLSRLPCGHAYYC